MLFRSIVTVTARELAVRYEGFATGKPAIALYATAIVTTLGVMVAVNGFGATNDEILFSGQTGMPQLIAETSLGLVAVMLIVKLVAYAAALGGGFRGGPMFYAEALGYVFKVLSDPSKKTLPSTEALIEPFRAALESKSFSALYAVALVECNQTVDRSRIEGKWRKYDQGSDPAILVKHLEGKGTGWCTASGSAPAHLNGGDFHVY